MDDREFWIAFRRWLKGRVSADQQMIAASILPPYTALAPVIYAGA